MTRDDGAPLKWKSIRLVPVLHNRLEFAWAVRRAFGAFKPEHVAVEYPPTLKDRIIQGIKRLPLLSVVHYEEDDGTFRYLLLEPTDGQVEAIRLALSHGIPVHFIDRDTRHYTLDHVPLPDPYALTRIGHTAYCRAYMKARREETGSREDVLREKTMAYHLNQLAGTGERVLFVGGLFHTARLLNLLNEPQAPVIGRQKRERVGLAHLHRDSSRELLAEMPYLTAQYERYRNHEVDFPDRLQCQAALIDLARESHRHKTREDLSHSELRVLNTFARNYAFLTGNLVPGFYQLIVAARGAVDDDFAYEVWDKGSDYPWQTDSPGLPVLRLRGEDLFLDQETDPISSPAQDHAEAPGSRTRQKEATGAIPPESGGRPSGGMPSAPIRPKTWWWRDTASI
ncbi:MAG: hypothetical protein U5R49_01440 [Deltaproteobacteria bacterium]|nr:hypothetical protein [Deltaproteobacteria bacterium]